MSASFADRSVGEIAATLPGDACRSWCALHAGVREFTDGLTEHAPLGNNVPFPRFGA